MLVTYPHATGDFPWKKSRYSVRNSYSVRRLLKMNRLGQRNLGKAPVFPMNFPQFWKRSFEFRRVERHLWLNQSVLALFGIEFRIDSF